MSDLFATPELAWLAVVPVVLGLLLAWTSRQRDRLVQEIGRPATVFRLLTVTRRRTAGIRILSLLVWGLLTIGLMRPQWGQSREPAVAVGRDLVLVLDFSRSMWAEDMTSRTHPARWEAAIAGIRSWLETMRTRGGNRVGIVIFAARPQVLVPLTTDFDHLLDRITELNATIPPAAIRPNAESAVSGTRIGAAIQAAVATHDPRFPGFQDILLLTDGDDPVDDREWQTGIVAARSAQIPVHVVGLGDPTAPSFILERGEPLETTEPNDVRVPIQTRLHEEVCRAIARETRGSYWPGRQQVPDVTEFYFQTIDSNATRELSDDRLPQPRPRYRWFVAPALVLLLGIWWRTR